MSLYGTNDALKRIVKLLDKQNDILEKRNVLLKRQNDILSVHYYRNPADIFCKGVEDDMEKLHLRNEETKKRLKAENESLS